MDKMKMTKRGKMKMTLKEYYIKFIEQTHPLPNAIISQDMITRYGLEDCLGDYIDSQYKNYILIDAHYMMKKYANLVIDETSDSDAVMQNNFTVSVDMAILKNAYKWRETWDTLNYVYNPIWNVDGTEVTEYDEFEIDNDFPSKTKTDSIGVKERRDTYGAQNVTMTNSNVPVDDTSYFDTQKQVNGSQTYTDTHHDDATAVTTTENAHIDKKIEKEHSVTLTRQGNIGVTKTQELIQSQRDIVNIKFYDIVFRDIFETVCIPYFESEVE